jgi:nucleotide-binding universal stress UspA family protein
MKTILVPVDFSDNSKNAMDYAIMLANKLNMKLLILHAFNAPVAELVSSSYKTETNNKIETTQREVENELRIWREVVNNSEKNIDCSTLFIKGDLIDEIAQVIREHAIDLIVMGTKGASGLKKIFIGSNTERIIEKVSCPVIAVPAEYQFDGIRKIIFATDYHDSDIVSIGFVAQLATLFDSELIIVHKADREFKVEFEEDLLDDFVNQVEKSVKYDKIKFHLLKSNGVHHSLDEFINEQKADLLAISTKGGISINPIFNRSLTRKFADHIQIPLLAFHAFDKDDKVN